MPRVAKGGLSRHPSKGYRISIGQYEKDGRRLPKVFWLGHDPLTATYAADQFRGSWNSIKLLGGDVWTEEEIKGVQDAVQFFNKARAALFDRQKRDEERAAEELKRVTDVRQELVERFGPPPGTAAPPVQKKERVSAEAMLYEAVTAFLESFRGKRKSLRHKDRIDQVLNVNLKHVRKDIALREIDFLWIDKLCDHFKSRPANQKDGKKPLSAASVKGILTYLRIFFTWLDDVEFGGWEMPRKAIKCFRVRLDDLLTAEEVAAAATIQQFDINTLKKLYKAATARQRSIMLAALFTGATQHELAVMKKSEFDLDEALLKHVRHKTKVMGHYWLPQELVKLLRAEFTARPDDELVWRTDEGNPLVTYGEENQTSDSVRQFWDDLRDKAEVPDALSFKYLRKYLADYCARHGGEEMGAVAMSHSRRTVLARNYSTGRPFARFHELQMQMHRELLAAGLFV